MSAKYACIAAHRATYPIALMCRVLEVSRAGYYAAHARPLSARAQADVALTTRIAVVHAESRGTYGAPRVLARLQQEGLAISEKRIARLMRAAGLAGRVPRRWRAPGTSDRAMPIPNRLAREFAPTATLNTRWAADITYLPYAGGLAYLAVVLDLSSRRVIGWRVAAHLQTELPLGALQQALAARPGPTLHHSDRGSQGGFNRSSQHLQSRGVYGATRRMDEGIDREGRDALSRGSLASARSRASILGTDCDGSH